MPVCLQVVHCLLIYDVIRKLVETFTERDVELLLLLLKSKQNPIFTIPLCQCLVSSTDTGMEIRKDDASSLKVYSS